MWRLDVTLREIDELYEREIADFEGEQPDGAVAEFCPTLADGTPDWWRLLLERSRRGVH
jgi:hypothetical protein